MIAMMVMVIMSVINVRSIHSYKVLKVGIKDMVSRPYLSVSFGG